MITCEEALQLALASVNVLAKEILPLEACDGRVLSRPLRAKINLPRFEQSAMDGIAVLASDLAGASPATPVTLALQGEIAAGQGRRPALRTGQACKVFTGGLLPRGADAVVMKEDCRFANGCVHVSRAAKPGDHIRRAGEEMCKGDLLASAGDSLNPARLGLLASQGLQRLEVFRQPVVALITMGDEVVPPGARLGAGKIHDANGPALVAALKRAGARRVIHHHAPDEAVILRRLLTRSLRAADLVVTVGGASVGDHDHVAEVRAQLGIRDVYTKVAIKPGKPNVFGLSADGTPVFSLPGNPVSALVSYVLFVLPALRRMSGVPHCEPVRRQARLRHELRKKPGRLEWVRARVQLEQDEAWITPLTGQGSHMLSSLAAANALIEFPLAAECLASGSQVRYLPLEYGTCSS